MTSCRAESVLAEPGEPRATHLELGADARGLLLLVQVQQRLGGAVVQGHTDDELQGLGVQQVLGRTHRVWPALLRPQQAPGGTDSGARTMLLGGDSLVLVSRLCYRKVGAGDPGGTKSGLCL